MTELTFGAQSLRFDLENGCALYRGRNGAPSIIMPRFGRPKPITHGQVDDMFVAELLATNLIHETSWGACALTSS